MVYGSDLPWPEAGCCSPGGRDCVCLPMEMALRGYIRGDSLPPMTEQMRAACTAEITRVEGYTLADAQGTDAEVARTVLDAWTDYCRDKGML